MTELFSIRLLINGLANLYLYVKILIVFTNKEINFDYSVIIPNQISCCLSLDIFTKNVFKDFELSKNLIVKLLTESFFYNAMIYRCSQIISNNYKPNKLLVNIVNPKCKTLPIDIFSHFQRM